MNLLEELRSDHRGFEATLRRLDELADVLDRRFFADEAAKQARQEANILLCGLIAAMRIHEAAEERLLFPEIRRHAAGESLIMDQIEFEHRQLERLFDDAQASLPPFSRSTHRPAKSLKSLVAALRRHIAHEESNIYAPAQASIPEAEFERLGRGVKV